MGWYYAIGDRREGPVGEETLRDLVRAGTVTGDTLVWRQGMSGWSPWSEIAPHTGTGLGVCQGCNRSFPEEDLVEIQGVPICAGCKPEHLQCLREGVIPATVSGTRAFQRDGRMICVLGRALPPRCVRCNAPAARAYTRTFYWHPNWLYLLLFVGGPLILVLVLIFVRRKTSLDIPLCEEHDAIRARQIRIGHIASWASVALLVGAIFIAPSGRIADMARFIGLVLGLIGILVAVGWTSYLTNILTVRRIGKLTAEFSRAGSGYLESLPPWPGGPE